MRYLRRQWNLPQVVEYSFMQFSWWFSRSVALWLASCSAVSAAVSALLLPPPPPPPLLLLVPHTLPGGSVTEAAARLEAEMLKQRTTSWRENRSTHRAGSPSLPARPVCW